MTVENPMQQHAELTARFVNETCSRTVNAFAQEAKVDGETLQQAVERYQIDYAWHILGSDWMREKTVSLLEAKLARPATDEQKAHVAGVLKSAAAVQAPESLMSFDNDVAEHLGGMLWAWYADKPMAAAAC